MLKYFSPHIGCASLIFPHHNWSLLSLACHQCLAVLGAFFHHVLAVLGAHFPPCVWLCWVLYSTMFGCAGCFSTMCLAVLASHFPPCVDCSGFSFSTMCLAVLGAFESFVWLYCVLVFHHVFVCAGCFFPPCVWQCWVLVFHYVFRCAGCLFFTKCLAVLGSRFLPCVWLSWVLGSAARTSLVAAVRTDSSLSCFSLRWVLLAEHDGLRSWGPRAPEPGSVTGLLGLVALQ